MNANTYTGGNEMHTINATTARKDIFNLIDEVNDSADAITITKGESEAVLMGADEYRSIMETLH
ncbi:type II toxin-antitoxin system Phd/YefM family antitoxin, partial [Herbiconiux daphne]|uniref:type II toxin-antitoxin system Phd/YefM family antitoxin n=1 Tax=Herbiconiux daphne TaxID=2970914 RepID=UPI0038B39A99